MLLDRLKPLLLPALLILLAVFGGAGGALYLDDGDPNTAPIKIIGFDQLADAFEQSTLTVQGEGAQPDLTIPVDPDNQQTPEDVDAAATDHTLGLHEDARDETPPGIPESTLEQGAERTEELADGLDPPQEPAGAQSYSCKRNHVVNQSSLSGPRVGVVLHFTVSNPGSLDAIRGLFNTPAFGASSNFGFELFNGRCEEWVPPNKKAWTTGAANSAYESIEIITNDRSRASWLATPAFQKGTLAALVRDRLKAIGAPAKLVDPVGCVFPPGVTDHGRVQCGNSHWDVGDNFPWDVFMKQVRQGVKPPSPLTGKERRIVHRTSKGTRRSKARACEMNRNQRAKLRRAGFSTKRGRQLRRGARYKRLQTNHRRRCQRQ